MKDALFTAAIVIVLAAIGSGTASVMALLFGCCSKWAL